MKVQIIGAGLIGGSVALAAREMGHEVQLVDLDSERSDFAGNLLGVKVGKFDYDVCFIGVPPQSVAGVISDENRLNPNAVFIDVSSVKTEVIVDVEAVCGEIANYVPSHPMAGKEQSGPEAATFDLFQDRVWVLTPNAYTDKRAVGLATDLLEEFGAIVKVMSASDHDALVALTSHAPQVLASALATLTQSFSEDQLRVSGNGLRDMTRLASSSADLWAEILIANRSNVSAVLNQITSSLADLDKYLNTENVLMVKQFIDKGKSAKSRLPGKHGEQPRPFEVVSIQIDDRPGALADIFNLAKDLNINIEDVRIDHALGRQIAIVELYVLPESHTELSTALIEDGWKLRAVAQ